MSEIVTHRGDTKPIVFRLWEDKEAGTPLDILGYSFRFTVNKEKAPVDGVNLPEFSLVGEIVGVTTDGRVRFLRSVIDMDLSPATYFFDFEVTDADGFIATEMLDKFKVSQDISK